MAIPKSVLNAAMVLFTGTHIDVREYSDAALATIQWCRGKAYLQNSNFELDVNYEQFFQKDLKLKNSITSYAFDLLISLQVLNSKIHHMF